MESKHTPGPWRADLNHYDQEWRVYADSEMSPIVNSLFKPKGTIGEANARLIAAAPDLLAALEGLFRECAMMHRYWGEGDNTKAADEAERFAREAIAKAKGEK